MRHSHNARGMTLVEVTIAVVLCSIAIAATGMISHVSQSAIQTAAMQADLESKALTILDRIANEVKDSGDQYSLFEISPDDSGSATSADRKLTFARCTGFSSGSPIFGAKVVIQCRMINDRLCLERTEASAAGPQIQILCDNLSEFDPRSGTIAELPPASPHRFPPDSPLGTPAPGSNSCYGINFARTGTVLTITVALQGQNFMRLQNKLGIDDRPFVVCQTQVQLKMMQ